MNRLCFSTLGCPGEPIDRVLAHAAIGGCTGVELRCREGELIAPDTSYEASRAVGNALRAGGIEPACLATYVQIGAPGDVTDALDHHIRLAAAAGIAALRVFSGEPDDPQVPRRAVERLRATASTAADAGVSVLIETHDALLDGRSIALVLEEAAIPSAGAVWDMLNPWRTGEDPHETARHLAPWLRHVQVKDAASQLDLRPLIPGTGVVPIGPILTLLAEIDYRGWVSLEWEAAWYPDAAPLDEALMAFAAIMKGAAHA